MAIKTFSTLYAYAARHWGNENATGSDLTIMKDLVNRAYSQALCKYPWQFLNRTKQITFTADKYTYSLPADFERIVTDRIPYDTVETHKHLNRRSINQIRRWRVESDISDQPTAFDIIPHDYSKEVGSAWQLEVYPTPDATYTATLFYRADPGELTDDDDTIAGHQAFYNLVQQMILAEIELVEDGSVGPQNAKVAGVLQDAIDFDDRMEPDQLGSYLMPFDSSRDKQTGDHTYYNTFGS